MGKSSVAHSPSNKWLLIAFMRSPLTSVTLDKDAAQGRAAAWALELLNRVTAQVRRPGCELAIDFSRRPNRFSIQESNDSRSGKRSVQGRTDRADWGAEG